MLVLAIETSTDVASLCLMQDHKVLSEVNSENLREHSDWIHPAVERCLKSSGKTLEEVGLIAVDHGPGSFTGIRVGINVARTLAYVRNLKVISSDSLSLLHANASGKVLCLLNAYRNSVFVSAYDNGKKIFGPELLSLPELVSRIGTTKWECRGDGFETYKTQIPRELHSQLTEGNLRHPLAQDLAIYASKNLNTTMDWKSLLPLYLRPSSAEEKLVT